MKAKRSHLSETKKSVGVVVLFQVARASTTIHLSSRCVDIIWRNSGAESIQNKNNTTLEDLQIFKRLFNTIFEENEIWKTVFLQHWAQQRSWIKCEAFKLRLWLILYDPADSITRDVEHQNVDKFADALNFHQHRPHFCETSTIWHENIMTGLWLLTIRSLQLIKHEQFL